MVPGMKLEYIRLVGLLATAAIVLGVAIGGCGGDGDGNSPSTATGAAKTTEAEGGSEYVEVLGEMREAATGSASFDGYGFAEYMPSTQRAAIDAFCFVADRVAKAPGGETVASADLNERIVGKAEADLKSERNIVAPGPAHRAIAKLRTVLGLESLDPGLAERYVHACYR
jgi:hypothetical protein